jgi:hypothetical protein
LPFSEAPEEWKKPLPPLQAAFILTDPADPRHQAHARFRERLGQFVLKAARYLRDQGGDDSTDAVTGIVGMLSTYRSSFCPPAAITGPTLIASSTPRSPCARHRRAHMGLQEEEL